MRRQTNKPTKEIPPLGRHLPLSICSRSYKLTFYACGGTLSRASLLVTVSVCVFIVLATCLGSPLEFTRPPLFPIPHPPPSPSALSSSDSPLESELCST